MIRFVRAPAIAALVAACTGCLPVIAHGPRVEPGASVGVTASFAQGPSYPDSDDGPFLMGPIGVNFGAGWGGERPGRGAVRVGVHLPVPYFLLAQGDVYLQLPSGWLGPYDGGMGMSASVADAGPALMPYVQFGRINERGSGWYTTQGVYSRREGRSQIVRETGAVLWVPSLAYQSTSGRTTTHLFVTGAFGSRRCRECYSPDGGRWVLAAGVTAEIHRRPRRRPATSR